jgi:two-component sensor histidine kinase
VPLRIKGDVIGVLQAVDTEVGRFDTTDLELLELLAATAAMAIENARLYEQARRDAETRSVLLQEINHRVKNNLSAIVGLLYAERRHAEATTRGVEVQAVYQSIIQDLISRVQSLATVHGLLSASEWEPLLLSELTAQVIRSALQVLPRDKRASVDVTPSPVRVTSEQAHHLALVINELATNTIKHGLRERDTVHISARIGLDNHKVLLEFRNDGPGYPEEVLRLERHDVGLDLVQKIVCKNLRGELSLYNDRGAVAVIRFEAKA